MLEIDLYERMRIRPNARPLMRQTWLDLTFLHFPVEPATIQATLPPGLNVDTYPDESGQERAWIGFVPFRMKDVRFIRSPNVPGCSAFAETNIRTYVHSQGKNPGVWFYSLDAANSFACAAARATFGLPYYPARMTCLRSGGEILYKSRRWRSESGVDGKTRIEVAREPAEPGSLDFFLIERYVLYSLFRGRLMTGQVHHNPYPLRAMHWEGSQTLTAAAGFNPLPWESQIFSDGVQVEVFPLRPCGSYER